MILALAWVIITVAKAGAASLVQDWVFIDMAKTGISLAQYRFDPAVDSGDFLHGVLLSVLDSTIICRIFSILQDSSGFLLKK
ncbi:hypothetical protein WA026_007988 [Henosepilachna vigintioctopunctata]|uniref:Uncharacterized protein n=1 Tax=Henosepilachna vigintioctopunctata TaxID=420089 RepID=A0AAW1TIE6_9CUCU